MVGKNAFLLALSLTLCSWTATLADNDGRAGSWHKAAQGAPSLKAAQKLVEKNPQDAAANNDLGWAHRQNGQLKDAEHYLRIAVKLDEKMPQAHSNLSVVLLDQGKGQEAVSEALTAIACDSNNPIYHVVLGNALSKQGDNKTAVEQYGTAIKLKPDYENALYNLGRVQLATGDRNGAKAQLAEALKYDPTDDRVLRLLDQLKDDGTAAAK